MAMASFVLESSAFSHHQEIPSQYTCEGKNISPPLQWKGEPANTKSFAIIVDDPDAPDPAAPQRTWVHWVVLNLPADTHSLAEDIHSLPARAKEGLNDWHAAKYQGPCPPIGRHHYHLKIYALDGFISIEKPLDKKELEKAMNGHILAQAELIGTYQKQH